jgi:hydroxymethylglutaryl-CoA reductase
MSNSRITGFYRLSIEDRVNALASRGVLSSADAERLRGGTPLLSLETADRMIENVIGVFGLPFAVAPNFLVNDKDYLVPMVVEEPSIVAGVSGAARLFRESGGISVSGAEPVMIGQVQIVGIADPDKAVQSLYAARAELIEVANKLQSNLVERGGGARGIEFYKYRLPDGDWTVVLHLLVDTRDAMGANIVNTMCEGLAARVEEICGGNVVLRILSNLADKSLARAKVTITLSSLATAGYSAEFVRDGIVLANDFANADPYRAATHNKGIMNGIDAVAIATGNDWRAIEAGAHAFAARSGSYRSLTSWTLEPNGDLSGELVVPLKVGIVGGSLSSNPGAKVGLAITAVSSAPELARLMAATGLAQNFAALRALVSHGIQKGHMSLHARSVAAAAGVPEHRFREVVADLIESGEVKTWKAAELLGAGEPAADTVLQPLPGLATGKACGKVILLGEHAVVYDRHALALPIDAAVTAQIVERDKGITLEIPDWGISHDWSNPAHASGGASGIIDLIMLELGVTGGGFDIRVYARIPVGMGLGSSAAFAVAVIRAFDQHLGLNKTDLEIDRLAYRCERLSHGRPSGIDNNVATFGEPVLFSRIGSSRTRPLELSQVPPLVIASSGKPGATRDMVAGVRARYERNKEMYTTIFNEIDELSVAGAAALREGDYEYLGSMMNVCQGFLNAIEVSTPELEKMIDIARTAGAIGAKLTGAGGGGSIVALCPGTEDAVASALRQAGYEIIRMDANQES